MEIANCRVILDKNGSDVERRGVTPAEAQILRHLHSGNAGQVPLKEVKVYGVASNIGPVKDGKPTLVERTDAQEVARLRSIYHKKVIDELFPGANPKVPATFEEALKVVDARPTEPETMGSPALDALPLPTKAAATKPTEPGK